MVPNTKLTKEQVAVLKAIASEKREVRRLAKIKAGNVYESARENGMSPREAGKKAKEFYRVVTK
jgi:hypothetical protein